MYIQQENVVTMFCPSGLSTKWLEDWMADNPE